MNEAAVIVDANLAFKALVSNRGDLRERLQASRNVWTEDGVLRTGLSARGFYRFFEP